MADTEEPEFLDDLLASLEAMREQLAAGKLEDVRLGIRAMQDAIEGRRSDLEDD